MGGDLEIQDIFIVFIIKQPYVHTNHFNPYFLIQIIHNFFLLIHNFFLLLKKKKN